MAEITDDAVHAPSGRRAGSPRRADDPALPSRVDEAEEPAAFRDKIAYHLRLAQEASFAAIRQGAGDAELKPGWYTLLTILHDSPGLTPGTLSRLCGRDRSTLTGTLKQLSSHGLISRRRRTADQRSYVVRLTGKGTAMLDTMRAHAQRHDARLDALAGGDKAVLLAALRRIACGLKTTTEGTDE